MGKADEVGGWQWAVENHGSMISESPLPAKGEDLGEGSSKLKLRF